MLFLPSRFFELFDKYGGYKTGKLKLKKPKQLQVSDKKTILLFTKSNKRSFCEVKEVFVCHQFCKISYF